MRLSDSLALLSLALLTACTAGQPVPAGERVENASLSRKKALGEVRGQVLVPARLLSDANKGTLISNGGASVISNGGAGLISNAGASLTGKSLRAPRHLLAAQTFPLRGAKVYLTTTAGVKVAGTREARTDEQGTYRLTEVPPTAPYIVVVEAPTAGGTTAQLRSVSLPGKTEVPVTLGSTLLTAAVASAVKDTGKTSAEAFDAVSKRIDAQLETVALPDLTQGEAPLKATLASLLAAEPSLDTEFQALRTQLGAPETKPSVDREESVPAVGSPASSPPGTPTASGTTSPAKPSEPVADISSPTTGSASSGNPTPAPNPTASATSPTPSVTYKMTVLAGGNRGSKDGTGTAASFARPQGLALRSDGVLFVADTESGRIRQVTPAGVVTTLSGATFDDPEGIAVAADGSIYVADTGMNRIQRISPQGVVTLFAGSVAGATDGTGSAASFNQPKGLAFATDGTLYVADTGNHRIRAISSGGQVTTLAGSSVGFKDGTGSAAQFSSPAGVAVGPDGTVAVADTGNQRVRYVTRSGSVSTAPGLSFGKPIGIALDASGVLYIADEDASRISRIPPGAAAVPVSTTSGLDFRDAVGLPVDAAGNIYLADTRNCRILRFSRE